MPDNDDIKPFPFEEPEPARAEGVAWQDLMQVKMAGDFAVNQRAQVFAKPPKPKPVDPPNFMYEFEGVVVNCPGYTKFITQNIQGEVICWEKEPLQVGITFIARGGRFKVVAKPEEYQTIIEALENPDAW